MSGVKLKTRCPGSKVLMSEGKEIAEKYHIFALPNIQIFSGRAHSLIFTSTQNPLLEHLYRKHPGL